jgi:hypothetical protein
MIYSELKATREDFEPHFDYVQALCDRTGKGAPFPNTSSALDCMIETAQRAMLTDIQTARGYDRTSTQHTTALEELLTDQLPFFQRALALKQLSLIMQKMQEGPESQTFHQWKHYDAEYDAAKARFASISRKVMGPRVNSVRIGL